MLATVNQSARDLGILKRQHTLIVTDLIDLARNRAITDALVLAGDEDLRIGVQIAQTFGVQTHLLGIKPARGSQSPDLIQECDTHREWDEAVITRIMTVTLGAKVQPDGTQPVADAGEIAQGYSAVVANQEIQATITLIGQEAYQSYSEAFRAKPTSVPAELDRQTLGRLGSKVGRQLEVAEVRDFRRIFLERLQADFPNN